LKVAVAATFVAALAISPLASAEEHEHGRSQGPRRNTKASLREWSCSVPRWKLCAPTAMSALSPRLPRRT